MVNGEIVNDTEIKIKFVLPYKKWNNENTLNLSEIPYKKPSK